VGLKDVDGLGELSGAPRARVHAAQRGDDGSEGCWWAFTRGDRETSPLDPATDIALDLGRDIPPSVREWALTAERHPGPARRPPDWVLTELLGTADPRTVGQDPFCSLFAQAAARQAICRVLARHTAGGLRRWVPVGRVAGAATRPGCSCSGMVRLRGLVQSPGLSG
jgi:hypothetical protein